jgi:hypothetical protein
MSGQVKDRRGACNSSRQAHSWSPGNEPTEHGRPEDANEIVDREA